MKKLIIPAALLAAGLAILPGRARAQSTTKVSVDEVNGTDLYLGFEESGNANDLQVDIGTESQYLNATSPFTVSFGLIPSGEPGAGTPVTSLLTDLNSIFTTGWSTSSGATALKWGITGDNENGAAILLFFSQDSANTVIPTNPLTANAASYSSKIDDFGYYLSTDFSTVNSSEAASVPATASQTNPGTWSSFNPSLGAFGTGLDIEESPGDGPLSTLNLYEETSSANGGGKAEDVGSFSLASDGDLTFTPAAVPEPSTWASIISGAFLLGYFQRRRRQCTA
jgi:hypothetical protein